LYRLAVVDQRGAAALLQTEAMRRRPAPFRHPARLGAGYAQTCSRRWWKHFFCNSGVIVRIEQAAQERFATAPSNGPAV